MTQQTDDSYIPLNINKMNEAQIITHFKQLKFVDAHGHPLHLCADLIDLIKAAKQ